MITKRIFIATFCVLAAVIPAVNTRADAIVIHGDTSSSTSDIGNFTGLVNYGYNPSLGFFDLTISLTNTSGDPNLKITGFVFNSDVNQVFATLKPNPTASFENIAGSKASPFGTFEFGAALGGDWLGGGSPADGIQKNASQTFHFAVTTTDATLNLSSLTPTDFLTEFGHDPSAGYPGQAFVVRFKGSGSDKVPTDTGGTPGPGLPLPSSALSGLGLLGSFGLIRRRAR
jgi:hypothetical protein